MTKNLVMFFLVGMLKLWREIRFFMAASSVVSMIGLDCESRSFPTKTFPVEI